MRSTGKGVAAVVGVVFVVVLAACGGGGDDEAGSDGDRGDATDTGAATEDAATDATDQGSDATDSTDGTDGHPATEDGLQDAARDYAGTLIDGDFAAAYRYASAACREQIPANDFEELVSDALTEVESSGGVAIDEVEVGAVMTRNVTGTSGEVQVDLVDADGEPVPLGDPEYDQWVYEDGDWRFGCEGDVADDGPSSSS